MTVAEKIKQRRLQMLVHSCMYYELNDSIVADDQWATWAKELVKLQEDYKSISDNVEWAEAFEGFDASTGYNLPVRDPWVMRKARQLLIWHKMYKGDVNNEEVCNHADALHHDVHVCELW